MQIFKISKRIHKIGPGKNSFCADTILNETIFFHDKADFKLMAIF